MDRRTVFRIMEFSGIHLAATRLRAISHNFRTTVNTQLKSLKQERIFRIKNP